VFKFFILNKKKKKSFDIKQRAVYNVSI
jgi:hypothetical protein